MRQGRRLCDPGAGGGFDPLDLRLLYECGGTADLRNIAAPRRPRVSTELDRELLITAGPGEWRAALLENGVPVELYVERGDRSEAGSIHLGRVLRLLPALGAALVDIGDARPAFLPQREIVPRGRPLHEGERVLVQIRREPQAGKAAQVTMGVRLRSRLLELIVGRPGLNGGEELPPDERGRMLAVIETLEVQGGAGLRLVGTGERRRACGRGRQPGSPLA